MSTPLAVRYLDRLSAEQQRAVRALAERSAADAGAPPLNDQTLLQLDDARPGLVHVLVGDGGALRGYGQLDGDAGELAAADGAAYGVLLHGLEKRAGSRLTIWTHGTASPLAPLLAGRGYRQTRLLHQLRLDLPAPLPAARVPDGVDVRTFRPGADEDAWLRLNAAAFAGHAEQGGWTRADLEAREAEDWFDPGGFFVAEGSLRPEQTNTEGSLRPEQGRGAGLLGFHWTKIHPDGAGEVYVLGVDPAAQGLRLGGALLAIGLGHLVRRGCSYLLLYVDDSNATAVRLYERFGFHRHDLDAQWAVG